MIRKIGITLGVVVAAGTLMLPALEGIAKRQLLAELAEFEPPAPYKIERDEWGVPSIYGATDEAVAFGMALAHAEDDFETVQMRLAPAKSQLGAITGKEGAIVDYVNRLVGSQAAAAANMDLLSEGARSMARGYAAGINAYAAQHPEEMLRRQLFPVTEEDVIAGFVLVSPFFYGFDDVLTKLNAGEIPEDEPLTDRRGSNAIVVAPHRMEDGSTLIISNSHQPWEGVAAWWEARIASGEGWSMAGPLFPGVPFILMGYNEHLSWTNTVNVPDLVDVYRLELDDSGKRYRFDGEWRDIEVEPFWIRVKLGPLTLPVRQKIERSVHGPVIRNDKGAFAVRYAGIGEVRHFEQYYALNRAKSFDDWKAAMRMNKIPSTNFLYADKEGNIAYLYNAAFPDRDPAIDWSGVMPGDSSDYLWTSYEPFDALPFYVNPPSGYLLNANNTPLLATAQEDNLTEADIAHLAGVENKYTNRILRITELFEAYRGQTMTLDQIREIRRDTGYRYDSPLGSLYKALIDDPAIEAADAEASALLRAWDQDLDGEGASDSIAALAIYDLYLGMRGYFEPKPHAQIVQDAAARLRDHFGSLEVPFTELSRLRRGDVDIPLIGGPDALRALYWVLEEEDGRLAGTAGDSYIGVIQWNAEGELIRAETVYPYGSAMGRPNSPHYADQAQLFADDEYKTAPLPDWRDAAALAENP
ncbi:MAG: penicillin acylase family protein [Parvularculaceae bacterium]|nr:penicillin acylase family protein [Parvularculaceae bacterium]